MEKSVSDLTAQLKKAEQSIKDLQTQLSREVNEKQALEATHRQTLLSLSSTQQDLANEVREREKLAAIKVKLEREVQELESCSKSQLTR